ncbi:2215_t:CDS:2, partial [Ambispora leptoticha]
KELAAPASTTLPEEIPNSNKSSDSNMELDSSSSTISTDVKINETTTDSNNMMEEPSSNSTEQKEIPFTTVMPRKYKGKNPKKNRLDGLTYEFFKDTKEIIVPKLTDLFNNILETREILSSWSKSLNLSELVNPICNDLIGPAQQAFISGRSITNTAIDIITVMRNQSDQTKQHWLLLLDQQKAFDRVNHNFIQIVLEKMNFDQRFINIISSLFTTQKAHIIDSGMISEPFRVERGIAAYADDLSIGISSPSDWSKLLEILTKYERASNAVINKAKSTLIPLTNIARRVELPNQNMFKLPSEDQDSFTILGYTVDIEGHPAKTL